MNILHLLPVWTVGGVETFISTLAKHSRHDHYVRADKEFTPLSDTVKQWGMEHVDVLHYHHACPVDYVPIRDDTASAMRVFTVHNYYEEQVFIGRPRVIVAVSKAAAGKVGNMANCDHIIPPPVDLSIFRGGLEGVAEWREELCLYDDTPVVMWAGRICPGKRPEILAEVIRANPQYTFLVVGDDYLAGGMGSVPDEVRMAIERATNTCHVPEVKHENMAALYRLADVFLSTSQREGFGLTVVEAMACGTPVIVPDVPALNEIVGHGEYGQCLNSLNVEDISRAIEDSLANRFHWQQRGVERVHTLGVDAVKVAARYDEAYEEVVR